MATTSIWKITRWLPKVVKYTTQEWKTENENYNPEISYKELHNVIEYAKSDYKTEKQFFVTGINCEKDSALEEMMNIKEYYNKTGGILGFHAIQSFKPGEVSPEIAHEIGVRFAKEMWGDRFQVVVSTHLNTDHIHSHFVINSVSFKDGLRYYDNHTNYAKMRHLSDELCQEYGLSIIEEKPTKKTHLNYANFYEKSKYTNSYELNAKRDLDLAIRQAYSYDDFIYLMNKLDYEIIYRADKISIKHKNYNRNIRIERRFGEDYSIENIKQRILNEQAVRVPFIESYYRKVKYPFAKRHKRAKAKGFVALYYHYCYLLKVFPTVPQQKLPISLRADIARMEELSMEAKLLSKNKIKTIEDLRNYSYEISFNLNELETERKRLWERRRICKDEENKLSITKEIGILNSKIEELRKEVQLAKDIETRIPKIEDNLNELDYQEEQEKNKENEKIKLRKEKKK